jgi:Na+/melibiose symporter-like transporter
MSQGPAASETPRVKWQMAASLGPIRRALATLGSIAAATATLIVVHGLWERAPEPRVREQVALFNLATLATVIIGVSALYLSIFAVSLAGAALLIDSSLLGEMIGHDPSAWDYLHRRSHAMPSGNAGDG